MTAPTTPSSPPAVDGLRSALEDHADTSPADVDRLRCLLAGRARFEAVVGEPPGGTLADLPPPFAGLELPPSTDHGPAAGLGSPTAADPVEIGRGYGSTVGADARAERGQFFTPPPVAAALVRWALDGTVAHDSPPRVLDPAVGTGTFLVAAFEQLGTRPPDDDPTTLLDKLVGVDVDPVALQLAGLRLAAAAGDARPAELPLHARSFFDCAPAGTDEAAGIDPVDVVVGNPPFVRADALRPDADHYRRHLATFGPDGETPLLDGPDALSGRSDAYVYFVTHATRFLRPGGRLAVVLPTKWLMSAYGEPLRQFLRDRYRVHAVVGFDARAFDALVDTSLLLAEREDDGGQQRPIGFHRLPSMPSEETLTSLSGAGADHEAVPTVTRPQGALTAPGSLARFLEAPAELLSLLESAPFVRLDAIAEVARGTMTGANRFFFVDGETVERFEIDSRVLRPAVKSIRSIDRPTVEPADVDRRIVDVHSAIAASSPAADVPRERTIKDVLADAGQDGLLAYIEHAEAAGWHRGRTCQTRPAWFDLGPLRAPAAFVPKLLRERVFVVRNAAAAIPSNAIDGVWPKEGVDPGALLAVMNATVGTAAMEVTGRDEAGLLQLMTYETASLPTLDVTSCTGAERRALSRAGQEFARAPGPATRAALDRAVAAAFDLPIAPRELTAHVRSLRRRRTGDGTSIAATPD